jgi:hypothetical protein
MTGLMVSGAVVLVSFILIGMAGNNSHSAPATTGGVLVVLAVMGAVIGAYGAIAHAAGVPTAGRRVRRAHRHPGAACMSRTGNKERSHGRWSSRAWSACVHAYAAAMRHVFQRHCEPDGPQLRWL